MSFKQRITGVFSWIKRQAEQVLTPRELRAVFYFLLFGSAIVVYRHGKRLYYEHYPERRDSLSLAHQKQQDSLFFALARQQEAQDSLFFSLPEDSLLPASYRARTEHHSKEEGLRLGAISLNKGSKEDLVRLPTVGPSTAEKILEYRAERGRFRKLDELTNIRGIGEKRLEKFRKYLRLD